MGRNRYFSLIKRKIVKAFTWIIKILFFDENQELYYGDSFRSYWEEYYGNDHRSFLSAMIVKLQAKRAFIDDGFRLDEFYLLGLEKKKEKERDLYLSRIQKDKFLVSYYGTDSREILDFLKDKFLFYTFQKDFFKRSATCIKSSEDYISFLSFCNIHHHIFVKQNNGSCGIGAKMFTISNSVQAGRVFDELVESGEWIIEELIKQDPAISAFNPSSVNTVRFPSFKRDGDVKCVFPCMRFGRAGSIIDNSTLGGLTVAIDEKTGELFPYAYDEKGVSYDAHPDSKVPFSGFQVPHWNSVIELVKKAHLALPDNQVYVAFDLALSDRGWCVVEGNWGDWFLQQFSRQRGMKKEFVSLLWGTDSK